MTTKNDNKKLNYQKNNSDRQENLEFYNLLGVWDVVGIKLAKLVIVDSGQD